MPATWDLYELFRRLMREQEEEMNKFFEEMQRAIEGLTPLYTIYEQGEAIYYIVDVPFVDYSTVYVKAESRSLLFSCQDKKGRKYSLRLPIPEKYDKYDIKVENNKSFIRIIIKKAES
ncbi:MAG: hypothetical protein K1T65_08830 [Candidatus Aramenus sp.]|nr:hypothetical protein [Candidatus Aramenus sp.]